MSLVKNSQIRGVAFGLGFLLTVAGPIPMALNTVVHASTPITVKISHGGMYTARASEAILTDPRIGIAWTCSTPHSTPVSKITGKINDGTHEGISPVKVGTATTFTFSDCTGIYGVVTMKAEALPYDIKIDSKTNSNGETDLLISGIDVAVAFTGCSFTMTGSAPGYYANATRKLQLTPNLPIIPMGKARLVISHAHGCAGLWKDGDQMTIKATYAFSIPVKISST